MKLKEIKIALSQLKSFECPKIKLEQYITPSELSATMIHTISTVYDDITDKKILDLCGGTGMLGINAMFYDPESVTNLDIDKDALDICRENCKLMDCNIELIETDFRKYQFEGVIFDVCLLNPPFGMQKKGIDIEAIEFALKYCKTVYVLHSNKTRDFYMKKFKNIEIIAEMKYDLPSTYKFHKKKNVTIDVDLYRILSEQ
ncbi:putative RNA methylase, partial [Pseudoloma neurophilia]